MGDDRLFISELTLRKAMLKLFVATLFERLSHRRPWGLNLVKLNLTVRKQRIENDQEH